MNKEFWDERYSNPEYVYGEEPNVYFREQLQKLPPGKILLPAEGEGRNAVYAARCGWDVFAFDQSEQGRIKALRLARKHNVKLDYQVGELKSISYLPENFDALALIYSHFPLDMRSSYHHRLTGYLKKGGIVILEAFSKKHQAFQQSNPHAGGPKDISMLYSLEDIAGDFNGFEMLELKEEETELEEGKFHSGTGAVIRFVGEKK